MELFIPLVYWRDRDVLRNALGRNTMTHKIGRCLMEFPWEKMERLCNFCEYDKNSSDHFSKKLLEEVLPPGLLSNV
jgi:hypothetical protein